MATNKKSNNNYDVKLTKVELRRVDTEHKLRYLLRRPRTVITTILRYLYWVGLSLVLPLSVWCFPLCAVVIILFPFMLWNSYFMQNRRLKYYNIESDFTELN